MVTARRLVRGFVPRISPANDSTTIACMGMHAFSTNEVPMKINSARELAEALFKDRQVRPAEAQGAWEEYRARLRTVNEKTARLRALRLARDAAGT